MLALCSDVALQVECYTVAHAAFADAGGKKDDVGHAREFGALLGSAKLRFLIRLRYALKYLRI